MSVLRFDNVSKQYPGGHVALADVSFEVQPGEMLFVTVRHTFSRDGTEAAVEEQDLVYRSGGEASRPAEVSFETPEVNAPWTLPVTADPVMLFRFSALTYNAHRIHYDADYSRAEEGYPNTVQNGGLTMQLLLDAAVAHTPGRLVGFSARLTRPIYVGDTITLAGHAAQGGGEGGLAHGPVAGVGDDEHVGGEGLAVLLEQPGEGG